MRRHNLRVAVAGLALLLSGVVLSAQSRGGAPAAGNPVVTFDTVKGTIEIELFAKDAPKSVERIVTLARENFFRGLRFHRVEKSLVQTGDPNSRDFTKRNVWGSGGSPRGPIGIVEMPKARRHVRGAVGLAHSGNAANANSQFYIMKAASPSLDGKHAVIGRVLAGMDIVDKLAAGDMITKVAIK